MGYVACFNLPGCLPESESVVFDTAGEAWSYLADEAQMDDSAWVPDDESDPTGPKSLHARVLEMQTYARESKNLAVCAAVNFDGYVWSVDWTDEPTTCRHSWVAGMMYVHDEDLDAVYAARSARGETIECERCEAVYTPRGVA
jgi:hypothetical protein